MTAANLSSPRGTYFFLSYAHVPPVLDEGAGPPAADGDYWVKALYEDLHRAVHDRVGDDAPLDIGFFDPLLPAGSDWKGLLARALGSAEVFVPLYSPRYLRPGSWPMKERASFRQRLLALDSRDDAGHFQPVLWIPLPARDALPESAQTLALGEGIPEYAENGLRALRMLRGYHDAYEEIVGRLADKIVTAAAQTPLGTSSVPPLTAVAVPDDPTSPAEKPFLVAVLAPDRDRLPVARAATTYGESALDWRPFIDGPTVSAAAFAANIAERLGLPARPIDVERSVAAFDDAPGLLLIDPWIAATDAGRARLGTVLSGLRRWVAALVVSDRRDPEYAERGSALAGEVLAMLPRASVKRPREAGNAEIFEQVVSLLVAQTRRQYLLHVNALAGGPPDSSARPRLGNRTSPRPDKGGT